MLEYWIVVTFGVIVVVAALCMTYLYAESRELRLVRSRYRLKVYEELFNAITDLNVAGTDAYKLERAKKRLAITLNISTKSTMQIPITMISWIFSSSRRKISWILVYNTSTAIAFF